MSFVTQWVTKDMWRPERHERHRAGDAHDDGALRHRVSVVTARRSDGSPVGTTVNAVVSVSLHPPLLLVCLARDAEFAMDGALAS
jgi:Flavin reductase like domain